MAQKAKASSKKSSSSKKSARQERVSEPASTKSASQKSAEPTRSNKVWWAAGGLAVLGLGAFAAKKMLTSKMPNAEMQNGETVNIDKEQFTATGSPPLFMKIRAAVQKFTKQPDLIRVHLENDIATLEGPIQLDELEKVVAAVEAIPGLSRVVNSLEAHEAANTSKFHA